MLEYCRIVVSKGMVINKTDLSCDYDYENRTFIIVISNNMSETITKAT